MNDLETPGNLCGDVSKDYAGYFEVDNSSLLTQLDSEVDAIQKLMDELYTTLLTLQESNKEMVDGRLMKFLEKAKELQSVFTQIDIIHDAVSNISSNVTQLEMAATAIDKQVDSNPLKKMFGFFKGHSERESEEVVIPPVFNTQTLFSRDVTPPDNPPHDIT